MVCRRVLLAENELANTVPTAFGKLSAKSRIQKNTENLEVSLVCKLVELSVLPSVLPTVFARANNFVAAKLVGKRKFSESFGRIAHICCSDWIP